MDLEAYKRWMETELEDSALTDELKSIEGVEAPKHEHVACPTCGLCTAEDCDGAASEKCAGHAVTPELPTEGVVTLAQAVEIANKQAHNTYTTGKFIVTGVVTDLYNTQYGNFHLVDANGNDLTIYGLYHTMQLHFFSNHYLQVLHLI